MLSFLSVGTVSTWTPPLRSKKRHWLVACQVFPWQKFKVLVSEWFWFILYTCDVPALLFFVQKWVNQGFEVTSFCFDGSRLCGCAWVNMEPGTWGKLLMSWTKRNIKQRYLESPWYQSHAWQHVTIHVFYNTVYLHTHLHGVIKWSFQTNLNSRLTSYSTAISGVIFRWKRFPCCNTNSRFRSPDSALCPEIFANGTWNLRKEHYTGQLENHGGRLVLHLNCGGNGMLASS